MSGMPAFIRALWPGRDREVSVPPMDGVFKPNNGLEEAEVVAALAGVDTLVSTRRGLVCSAGGGLYLIDDRQTGAEPAGIAAFPGVITSVAELVGGPLLVSVEGVDLFVGLPDSGFRRLNLPKSVSRCAVAATAGDGDTAYVCVGSSDQAASDWKRDLMQHGRSGSVLAINCADGSLRAIATGLAFPGGIARRGNGQLVASESWRHRLVEIDPAGPRPPVVLLDDLAGYPSRLSPAGDGSYWLALFAPRRQLTELVLREDDYRSEMLATIDPADWIGPALSADGGPQQPLQQGSVRQMGLLKPWAPSRSYGLVARCDADLKPRASWHSRADGSRHGVTSAVEHGGAVYAASRGAGLVLRLKPEAGPGKGLRHG